MNLDIFQKFDRKSLLIGIAVLLFILVIGNFAHSMYGRYAQDLNAKVDTLQMKYRKLQGLVQNKDELSSFNTSLKQFQNTIFSSHFIPGGTKSLAQAQFQKIAKRLAEENDINIRVTKVLESEEMKNMNVMKLQISARSEIGAINSFLQALKSNAHYIFAKELEIKRINANENRYYYVNAQLIGLTQ